MSEEWVVEQAVVIPSIAPLDSVQPHVVAQAMCTTNDGTNLNNLTTSMIADHYSSISVALKNSGEGGEGNKEMDANNRNMDGDSFCSLDVDGPQPSMVWPSDHFMIVVKASF